MTVKSTPCNPAKSMDTIGPADKGSNRDISRLIQTVFFLGLCYLYVYLWIDPTIIYHGHGQTLLYPLSHSLTGAYDGYPAFPGKAVMSLAAWLPYFYYHSWAGALIITAIAGWLCIGIDQFMITIGIRRMRWLRFIPAIFLLAQHSRCYPLLLAENLALALALLFLFCYRYLIGRRTVERLLVFAVLAGGLYATAVQIYLVFVLMTVLIELFNQRRFNTVLLWLLTALFMPFLLNVVLFKMDPMKAYRVILSFSFNTNIKDVILIISFYGLFPVLGLVAGISRYLAGRHKAENKTHKKSKAQKNNPPVRKKFPGILSSRWLIRTMETLAILMAAAVILWNTCNPDLRLKQQVNYLARQKSWDKLLQLTYQAQSSDMFICHEIDRALYHSGRLLQDMFLYPQHYAALLLTAEEDLPNDLLIQQYVKTSEIFYELGHINDAENAAYEALAILNYYPQGLWQLAQIHIIKDQPAAARTLLNALKEDRWYRDRAEACLRQLEADPQLSQDKDIQRQRSFMLTSDSIVKTTPLDLFRKNKANRMAFEYLMAFYLLTGQYDLVAQGVVYLDNYDYPSGKIPRLMAEAILLHTARTGEPLNLYGRRIDASTVERFEKFMQHYQNPGLNLVAARNFLQQNFHDTYYYFYFFLMDRSS